MKAKSLFKSVFYILSCFAFGYIVFVFLDNYCGKVLGGYVRDSSTIFEGILCDDQNILKIKPNYKKQWKGKEFNVAIRTNSRGYREDFEFEDNDIDIAFMGDSFTFGHGVDVANRYTNVVAEKYPQMTVVSLSYNNGFQPEHYEYFLDNHPDLKPRLLFVGLYLGNDFDSDITETVIDRDNYGKIIKLQLPYRDVYLGTLTNKVKYKYGWLSNFIKATNLGKVIMKRINSSPRLRCKLIKDQTVIPNTPNRLSTELGDLDQHNLRAIRSLKEIARKIEMRNGELHILLIPQNFLVGCTESPHIAYDNRDRIDEIRAKNGLMKAVINLCESEGLKCHDLSKILTSNDYYKKDSHWNEQGHGKVGAYISKIVESKIADSSITS